MPDTQSNLPTSADDMICLALYRASHAITRRYTPMLRNLGLTYPQWITLDRALGRRSPNRIRIVQTPRHGKQHTHALAQTAGKPRPHHAHAQHGRRTSGHHRPHPIRQGTANPRAPTSPNASSTAPALACQTSKRWCRPSPDCAQKSPMPQHHYPARPGNRLRLRRHPSCN